MSTRVRLRGHGIAHRKLALTTGHSGLCAPYAVTKDDQYRAQPAAPAPAAEVRAALASARR